MMVSMVYAANMSIEGGVALNSTPLESATSSDSSGHSTPDSSDPASVSPGAIDISSSAGSDRDSDSVSDLGFIEQFKQLAIENGWSKKEKAKHRYDFFDEAWDAAFGTDMSKLEKWQELCQMCKIEPVPESINKCKKVSQLSDLS